MCRGYGQIICKQKVMTTMAILLGWTGDVHTAPLCLNTCRKVCSSFMPSPLSPSQNCTPQFCFAFIQTFTAYLYHQTIISMKAGLIFSSAYWRKAQWLPVVVHFSMYYRRKHEPGCKGSHQLEDAGNQAIRTCTCSGLLHCASHFMLPWSFMVQRWSI